MQSAFPCFLVLNLPLLIDLGFPRSLFVLVFCVPSTEAYTQNYIHIQCILCDDHRIVSFHFHNKWFAFTTISLCSSRHRWVQSADTHLLEWQRVCEPPRRIRLCVYIWSGLQRWLSTGRRNQTQWRRLETQLWPLCYMLLQGREDEHTRTRVQMYLSKRN